MGTETDYERANNLYKRSSYDIPNFKFCIEIKPSFGAPEALSIVESIPAGTVNYGLYMKTQTKQSFYVFNYNVIL